MKINFPYYSTLDTIDIPDRNFMGIFEAGRFDSKISEKDIIKEAFESPIGAQRIRDILRPGNKVLVIVDDNHRPTPIFKIMPYLIRELEIAGSHDEDINIIVALGTHRKMTDEEIIKKIGEESFRRFKCVNPDINNSASYKYVGKTEIGIEVYVHELMARSDFFIGLGRIMPIEVCGFTGGGKIVVPGICSEETNGDMHWIRTDISQKDVIGKRDNSIRRAIDSMARKAGLNFIANAIIDNKERIVGMVTGDLVEAHRKGAEITSKVHGVVFEKRPDIVIADSFPFDIDFWQANKALDTAGIVVREGGVVILIAPCVEGLSSTHEEELLKYGYRDREFTKNLVKEKKLKHRVVAVHMLQVLEVKEKAQVIIVTNGVSEKVIRKIGLDYAPCVKEALEKAFGIVGREANVAILRHAAEMLPLIKNDAL